MSGPPSWHLSVAGEERHTDARYSIDRLFNNPQVFLYTHILDTAGWPKIGSSQTGNDFPNGGPTTVIAYHDPLAPESLQVDVLRFRLQSTSPLQPCEEPLSTYVLRAHLVPLTYGGCPRPSPIHCRPETCLSGTREEGGGKLSEYTARP